MDREHYLINRLKSDYIGDDAACVDGTLYSMDAFFEDVHFKREWMSMSQIGRKAMLVNLSDAIAMSAKPKYALVAISMPPDMSRDDIDELLDSMVSTAREFGCEIIGGDTISADKLHIAITIVSKSDNPLLRSSANSGDMIAYTGELGSSMRDLNTLLDGGTINATSRFYEPTLRAAFIYSVREYLSAGMDISDGLYCDTNKLLDASDIGLNATKEIPAQIGDSGEEYEMLITFPPSHRDRIVDIADNLNMSITIFGVLEDTEFRFDCHNHHD